MAKDANLPPTCEHAEMAHPPKLQATDANKTPPQATDANNTPSLLLVEYAEST